MLPSASRQAIWALAAPAQAELPRLEQQTLMGVHNK